MLLRAPPRTARRAPRRGDERFALLNEAFAVDGALVHAPKGADCAACVEILFVATEGSAERGSLIPGSKLQVEAERSCWAQFSATSALATTPIS